MSASVFRKRPSGACPWIRRQGCRPARQNVSPIRRPSTRSRWRCRTASTFSSCLIATAADPACTSRTSTAVIPHWSTRLEIGISCAPSRPTVVLSTCGPRPLETFVLAFDPSTLQRVGSPQSLGVGLMATGFSPDGRDLVVGQAGQAAPGDIQVREHFAGPDSATVHWPFDAAFHSRYPSVTDGKFSPDGRWIAFSAFQQRDKPAVFVVPRGGVTPTLVWDGSGFPAWMADSRRIYMWSERGDETHRQVGYVQFDPTTGRTDRIFHRLKFEPGRGATRLGVCGSMTPDRRWLLFGWDEFEGDVFVADVRIKK
jgi:hypothetical protein